MGIHSLSANRRGVWSEHDGDSISSRQQFVNHVRQFDSGEPLIQSLKTEAQLLVVKTQQMKERGVQVMHMDAIVDCVKAKFVRCAGSVAAN